MSVQQLHNPAELEALNARFDEASPEELLQWAVETFQRERPGDRITLACSLGMEDNVLVDMLARISEAPRVFVLDTGRLHEETYETLDSLRSRYKIDIQVMFPQPEDVEELTRKKGMFSFYESVENRKECCGIRKVEPLRRALSDVDAWITGLRRSQSVTRADIRKIEVDEGHGILKLNPLADWSEDDVEAYAEKHRVPLNPLHARGFPSIGCQPCTRAIEPGEDVRAGRWWWEAADSKECGLHVKK